MTDEQFDSEIDRIRKYYDKWAANLGLSHYKVERIYNRERKDDDLDVAAHTTSSWQYRLAHIQFYLPATGENDDNELEHIVLHEICHVLLSTVAQAVMDNHEHHIELATENMTRAIEDAYAAGQKDFK